MNIKKISITKILFYLSVILAMCFALQALGQKLLFPFPAEIKFDMPTGGCMTNSGEMLVTDSANTRLIFCDKKGKVCHIEKLDKTSPISRVIQLNKDDKYFYIRGVKLNSYTSLIQSEKVFRYDLDGKNRSLIFERTLKKQSQQHYFYNCCISGNRLYYITADPNEGSRKNTITVFSVDTYPETDDTPQRVFQSKILNIYKFQYLPHEKKLYSCDLLGHLYLESENNCWQIDLQGNTVGVFFTESDGSVIYSDPTNWNLYWDKTLIAENVESASLSSSEKYILFDNEYDGTLMRYNKLTKKTETLKSVQFSATFWVLTLLKFLSVIYIFALLFVLTVKFLISLFKNREYVLLRRIGFIVSGVFIVILISWFYTNYIYQMQLIEIKKDVLVQSKFFSDTADPESFSECAECFDRLQSHSGGVDDHAFEQMISKWAEYYGSYISAAESKGCFPYVALYPRIKDRYFITYNSTHYMQYGASFDFSSVITPTMDNLNKVGFSTLGGSESLYCMVPVKDTKGEIVGFIEVGEDFSEFKSKAASDILRLTVELLTIFVVIYLVLVEGKSLLLGLRRRKRYLLEKNPVPELTTVRSFSFLFYVLSSFDGVILVLISREMLISGGYSPNSITWLMSLPAVAWSIGLPIGTILYSFLASRIPIRKLAIGSIMLLAICLTLMIPAVMKNLFFAFVALKFFVGVAGCTSYSTISSMPFRTDNEVERYRGVRERTMGEVSGGVFGPLIAGFISHKFGNISLYVVNALNLVPLFVLMLIVLPKNCVYISRVSRKKGIGSLKNFGKFLISVPMLSYFVFLVLPLTITKGYKNYLFPLFSTSMEVSKLYITSFFVFARVIMLLINEPITKKARHIEHWKLTIMGMLAMGMAYLGFALNATFIWAVIMLLIDAVLSKIVSSSEEMLWPRQAKVFGLNIVETSNYMLLFDRIIYSFKEMLLSVFLLFGDKEACIAVGVFCVVFTILFALTTYRSALAKADAEQ
ncbi:MAG: MFS transporter [Synergistaceae bacterium]|nr:MFS transporter [Synergistaceae bacterium]